MDQHLQGGAGHRMFRARGQREIHVPIGDPQGDRCPGIGQGSGLQHEGIREAGGECRVQPNGPSGTWDLYLRVDDVAAEQQALAAAGVAIAKGPTDLFYAMREIEVLDPDGHRLCFAQDIS